MKSFFQNTILYFHEKYQKQLQTLDGVDIEHAERIKAIQRLPTITPIIQREERKYAITR